MAMVVATSHDGSVVAVGEPGLSMPGRVRVYHWGGSSWTQRGGDLYDDLDDDNDLHACVVALSSDGAVVTIGAPEKSYSGQVPYGGRPAPLTCAHVLTGRTRAPGTRVRMGRLRMGHARRRHRRRTNQRVLRHRGQPV